MNFDEIQQIFFQECEEGLATMESNFAAVRQGAYDTETINTIFRSVHSIKGGAGAFGHERLQAFTHEYETLLDLVRNGTLILTPALLGTIVSAFDMLADHVAAAREGGTPPVDAAMLARLIEAAHAPEPAPETAAASPAPVEPVPAAPAADSDFDDLFEICASPTADTGDAIVAHTGTAVGDGFDDLFAMCTTPAGDTTTEDGWRITLVPGPNALDHGGEPLLLLREVAALGAEVVVCDLSALPPIAELHPERAYLGWTLTAPASVAEDDIRAVFEFMADVTLTITPASEAAAAEAAPVAATPPPPTTPAPAPSASAAPKVPLAAVPVAEPVQATVLPAEGPAPRTAAAAVQTIRVDLDKLDRLVNLVGELVITQAMLAQRLSEHQLGGISELTDLDHLTRELQESTMAIRAQPMKTVFSRVPRIIRELEVETGKRVRLDIEGEMTEVDKTVVERIGEPLTHLIRNAVDHGLETPAERLEAGKPEEGVVTLSAAHHSGRIVITVADDGRGIDRKRVRAKAVERGIIAADAILTEEEIDNLIFAPGFSTAATVSNISGRGVGMDVVRKNVQALGGRIGISSQLGSGSSFALSLPLTLAVLDGMIVTVGEQTFVIPLGHIVESLRPDDEAVKVLGPTASLLDVRGAYVPVHRIAEQLGIGGAIKDPTEAVLIVVESDHGQAVLMVDSIQDQRQVVVKSLEANYEAIHGLAGATILGDGRVALILDVDALMSRWRRDPRHGAHTLELAA
ncbi:MULTISPECIES: chemotaxis protein CheA [unclassified Sphingomonas]|jgi:two-component system, chemotaxis family, sensor kinase CheA|uniref:chemotaxis protein CheA n=1 Tax=unclassified Sphingomonas TaxID=196159 RepID=UPI000E10AEF6|nr:MULTISPECIES: chemotaxis protein CheA [unclassified Sphingomonas]AXJ95030.1 chemotaxis protein CheA [Sphingomonas sp. FARSPH]